MLAMSGPQVAAFILRRLWSHGPATGRARRLAAFPVVGKSTMESWFATHVDLGSQLAERLGLGGAVSAAASGGYEEWGGKGEPGRRSGEQISLAPRLVQLAGPVEVLARQRDLDSLRAVIGRHAGSLYD